MELVPGNGPEDGEGVGRDVQVGLEHWNPKIIAVPDPIFKQLNH